LACILGINGLWINPRPIEALRSIL
jgi:hypothetical protein